MIMIPSQIVFFFIAHIEESNVFFGELFKLNLLYILLNY